MITRLQKVIFLSMLSGAHALTGFGTNLLMRPYDTLLRPEFSYNYWYEGAVWAVTGLRPGQGYDPEGRTHGIFSVYDTPVSNGQDALAMLDGFSADSPIGQLRAAVNAVDDGTRGHLIFNGKVSLRGGGVIGGKVSLLANTWITAFIPFYSVNFTDFSQQDLTQSLTTDDLRVKELITTPLDTLVATLGDGLYLGNWKRTGFGDANLFIESSFNFAQARPLLKNVEIDGRFGFTLPTGLRADEDKLLAFPFGYDGAVGLLFGGGLQVTLGCNFKAGLDVQLLHLFGNTRDRRIRTAIPQTDFLLLAKTPAYKDYGLTQRFNLFLQGYHLYQGLSFLLGYQYIKHGNDRLQLNTCDYNNNIANYAEYLREWTAHSVEAVVHYDFAEYACYQPQASLFLQLPFNGRRSILFTTIGAMIAIDF